MKQTIADLKPFMDEDFLLDNKMARVLYHEYAKHNPIIDYHNHLPPQAIAQNKSFDNLTQVWLYGDHYKWRAMRTFGIEEKFITGEASDKEKFLKWAETVPFSIRNPLFHWTHLELQRYFDITDLLTPDTAENIYQQCNDLLRTPEYSTLGLLRKMKVAVVCTTDDPIDTLEHHQTHREQDPDIKMFPAFRPDKAIMINSPGYHDYIRQLEKAADIDIKTYKDLVDALKKRVDYFDDNGCRISDHGLNKVYAEPFSPHQLELIFEKKMADREITDEEAQIFISGIMHDLGQMYADKSWVMQLHIGALRNNSSRMMRKLGPDTGFDSIGDYSHASELSAFLDALDNINKLPKTIIYNLNPRDNEVIATMIGNFNDGSIRGKIQFGSAWWFLDQKDGMEKQMTALSNMGLLSCFIGMLTDSRSFLSFPRHEYFRRILCNLIGRDVHNGELPYDEQWLGGIVENICYHNAKNYFGFESE